MTTSLDLAITAIRAGRREEGRQLLNLLIQQNPNNEKAWLWMSSVVDTDEQRARCLYHVLAITPDNTIARRGLQVLGIEISDSRPVKVPRDSQPIKIQRTQPKPQTGPLKSLPEPQSSLARASERRPFKIDPETIVEELPFTPAKAPFPTQTDAQVSPSQPLPVARPNQTEPLVHPSTPTPVAPQQTTPTQTEPRPSPSQPVPVVQPQPVPVASPTPVQPSQPVIVSTDSGPVIPVQVQAVTSNGIAIADTRPVQPSAIPAQIVVPVQPSGPMPVNAQQTAPMGVPMQPVPQQVMPIHSQATMGMPMQQPQAPSNVVIQPSNPVPVAHSHTTMGMPLPNFGQPQVQPQPAMVGATPSQQMQPSQMQNYAKLKKQIENEDSEEMNVLAVIIFGSLSVTALGGLGMLVLLMFTSG